MSEFYMIEGEESFVDSTHDVTRRIEDALKTVTTALLDKYANDINDAYVTSMPKEEQVDDDKRFAWLHKPFRTLTFSEAIDILQQHCPERMPRDNLSKADELFLVKHLDTPVFVVDWPKASKQFYMRQCRDNPNLVNTIPWHLMVFVLNMHAKQG